LDKRLLNLSSQEVAKILERFGFHVSRQKGSHIQFVGHFGNTKRRVTLIANQIHFAYKTMKSMIEQSGFNEDIWLKMV